MKLGILERLLFLGILHCNDGTGDGGGSGGEGPGDGAPGGDAGDGAGDGGQGSAISAGSALPISEAMPEKFRVFEGEGEEAKFNLEGSASKLIDSYTALEKRGGAPETPDDYAIDGTNISENFNFDEFKSDDTNKAFLKSMHAAGLNNGQVQKVLEYGMKELIPGLMSGNQSLNEADALEHMKNEVWKEGAQYSENMALSGKAYSSLSSELQQEVNNPDQPGGAIGNHPVFLKVMSIFGKEMGEDRSVEETSGLSDQVEVEKLMLSEAYKDSKHPDNAKVSKQVRDFYLAKTKGK